VPDRRARHPRQQGGHLAAGRPLGEALQVLPAGIHQGDDGRGEFLPDHQRRRHRQRRDDVEAEVAAPQTGHNLGDQRQQHRDGYRRPDRVRQGARAGQTGGESDRQPDGGEAGEIGTGEFEHASDVHCYKMPLRSRQRHARDQTAERNGQPLKDLIQRPDSG